MARAGESLKQTTIGQTKAVADDETQAQATRSSAGRTGNGKLKTTRKSKTETSSRASIDASPSGRPSKQSGHDSGTRSTPAGWPSKSNGGIQSFFNKATQITRSPTASQPLRPSDYALNELIENISSDDDDTSNAVQLSKGSSTALALRKRRFDNLNGVQRSNPGSTALPASQKFRKLDEDGRRVSPLVASKDERPWTDRFAPDSLDELAVHKRKTDDVRSWLEAAFRSRRNKALILKGPAGAGKTAAVRIIAKTLGVQAVEWTSPASRDLGESAASYALQFEEFMLRSGRSTGLELSAGEGISTAATPMSRTEERDKDHFLLVEDFPNTYSTSTNALLAFRSAIAQHLAAPVGGSSSVPLVFVISETALSTSTAAADSFTTHRLFGPELNMHPCIDTIEFNPIAPTFLLRALEQILLKEARVSGRRHIPGKAVLKRLADFGDIRSAISTLEFLLSRDGDSVWSSKVAFSKTKKKIETPLTAAEEEAMKWISSRASYLDIFHSVGKIVYNKRQPSAGSDLVVSPPEWLPQHRRPLKPENDVNDLVTEIGTETDTFIAALHENYLLSCGSSGTEAALECVSGCIENLSDSDLLCLDRLTARSQSNIGTAIDTLRQDEMAFQLGVRGVLFSLPVNAKRSAPTSGDKRDAFRMFYPASVKLWRHQAETNAALEGVLLGLRGLRPPEPPTSVMREHLYTSTGVRPHSEVSGKADEIRNAPSTLLRIPKQGLLLDCLSYVYSIVQIRDRSSPLLGQLRQVIWMSGFADNGAADEGGEESQQLGLERLTTAKTDDNKSGVKLRGGQAQHSRLSNAQLPPENAVASLVLQDDDIVDD